MGKDKHEHEWVDPKEVKDPKDPEVKITEYKCGKEKGK